MALGTSLPFWPALVFTYLEPSKPSLSLSLSSNTMRQHPDMSHSTVDTSSTDSKRLQLIILSIGAPRRPCRLLRPHLLHGAPTPRFPLFHASASYCHTPRLLPWQPLPDARRPEYPLHSHHTRCTHYTVLLDDTGVRGYGAHVCELCRHGERGVLEL